MTRRDATLLSESFIIVQQRIRAEYNDNKLSIDLRDAQLRGVRRAAAVIADAIQSDNNMLSAQEFLSDCGYGA